jgi:chorismate mutase
VLTDSLEAPHWLRIAKSGLRTIGPLTQDRKAGWFPIEETDEAQRFNRWLLGAEASGRLDRIRSQYGLPAGRTASPLPALLSSLDERLSLMPAVADAKQVLQLPIENLDREELVLDSAGQGIRQSADEAGVEAPDAAAIRRLFQSQIAAAKWIQARRRGILESGTDEWTPMTVAAARSDLEEVLRPSLIYLGDRISMLLVACVESPPQHLNFDDVSTALERHRLPGDHLRAIYDALSEIIQTEGEASP